MVSARSQGNAASVGRCQGPLPIRSGIASSHVFERGVEVPGEGPPVPARWFAARVASSERRVACPPKSTRSNFGRPETQPGKRTQRELGPGGGRDAGIDRRYREDSGRGRRLARPARRVDCGHGRLCASAGVLFHVRENPWNWTEPRCVGFADDSVWYRGVDRRGGRENGAETLRARSRSVRACGPLVRGDRRSVERPGVRDGLGGLSLRRRDATVLTGAWRAPRA